MKIRDLYKVETLDVRFASSTGQAHASAQASKWRTWEYSFYALVFLTIPALMFKSVYDVSRPSHPGYRHYEHLLSPGWIPGRKLDDSDAQYAGFRQNIPYMPLVLALHPVLRRVYESLFPRQTERDDDVRLQSRVSFDLIFAIVFLVALHGVSSLKVLLILSLNYHIATAFPPQYVGVATWIFNIGILFANELCHGYQLRDMTSHAWGARIDSYGGLVPRWEILFNITVLRLISFNFDYLWMRDRRAGSPIEVSQPRGPPSSSSSSSSHHPHHSQKKNLDPASLPERERVSLGARPADFTFRNYLAYTLYSPLYLTGPIINFNDYISQSRHPLPSTSTSRIIPYALRFFLCLLCMELVLHYLYAVAISKSSPEWSTYSPFQLSMLGYFNLHVIWLKLLIPWRFFRLWSLIDAIDPPENMVRCMSDNYSALAFWRGWHRSFNRFVVRYVYVPLGGSGQGKLRAMGNYLAVFTFVALWHDINLRLLMWGWLITLFVLPEVLATMAFPAKKWKDHPETYRFLCGVGAVGNILMMMAANLVGFAVGWDGLRGLVEGIVRGWEGRVFFLVACGTLFVGVQVMFEWREGEKRRGVHLKC